MCYFYDKKKYCHLKKLFCEGNYRLELSFSWLKNIMRIFSVSLNKSTKRWTCSFCVEYQEESGSLWTQANQTETSPPTLFALLPHSLSMSRKQEYHCFLILSVGSDKVCASGNENSHDHITPTTCHIGLFFSLHTLTKSDSLYIIFSLKIFI